MKTGGKSAFAICALFLACAFAYCQETAQECNDLIARLEKQRQALARKNPNVVFAEKDNPSINVQKSMRKTTINRIFMCPHHKGYSYTDYGTCSGTRTYRGDTMPCKAQIQYLQWKNLVEQAAETKRIDAEIEAINEKIEDAKARKKELSRSGSPAAGYGQDAAKGRGKQQINMRRSSLEKLMRDGVIENERFRIVVVD